MTKLIIGCLFLGVTVFLGLDFLFGNDVVGFLTQHGINNENAFIVFKLIFAVSVTLFITLVGIGYGEVKDGALINTFSKL